MVDKNPDIIAYRIELLTYYLKQKNISAFNRELTYIENTFNISEKQQEKVNNIKQTLEDQQNIGTQ